jgi:hypothetical protein
MKKFFENTLVIVSAIIVLAVSIYACIKEPDFKSIGGIAVSFIALIISVFFKLKKEEPEKGSAQNVVKGKNFTNNTIIQGNSGTVNINPQPKINEKD